MVLIQEDNTLGMVTDGLIEKESKSVDGFKGKQRNILFHTLTTFNGVKIRRKKGKKIRIDQKDKIEELKVPVDQNEF